MAKTRTVKMDRGTMMLLAGLATIAAANIMRRLYQRSVFNDEDVDAILQDIAAGGFGDRSLDALAQAMAESLRTQFETRAH